MMLVYLFFIIHILTVTTASLPKWALFNSAILAKRTANFKYIASAKDGIIRALWSDNRDSINSMELDDSILKVNIGDGDSAVVIEDWEGRGQIILGPARSVTLHLRHDHTLFFYIFQGPNVSIERLNTFFINRDNLISMLPNLDLNVAAFSAGLQVDAIVIRGRNPFLYESPIPTKSHHYFPSHPTTTEDNKKENTKEEVDLTIESTSESSDNEDEDLISNDSNKPKSTRREEGLQAKQTKKGTLSANDNSLQDEALLEGDYLMREIIGGSTNGPFIVGKSGKVDKKWTHCYNIINSTVRRENTERMRPLTTEEQLIYQEIITKYEKDRRESSMYKFNLHDCVMWNSQASLKGPFLVQKKVNQLKIVLIASPINFEIFALPSVHLRACSAEEENVLKVMEPTIKVGDKVSVEYKKFDPKKEYLVRSLSLQRGIVIISSSKRSQKLHSIHHSHLKVIKGTKK